MWLNYIQSRLKVNFAPCYKYIVSLFSFLHRHPARSTVLKVRIFAPAPSSCHFVILMTGPNYNLGNMQTVLRDHHSTQSCKDVISNRYTHKPHNGNYSKLSKEWINLL